MSSLVENYEYKKSGMGLRQDGIQRKEERDKLGEEEFGDPALGEEYTRGEC